MPAIAEQLHVPIQLTRQTFDSLRHRIVFGEEIANAAKQAPQRQGNASGLM